MLFSLLNYPAHSGTIHLPAPIGPPEVKHEQGEQEQKKKKR